MSTGAGGLLAANALFYSAFGAGDMRAMEDVWARDAPVACIHPGAPLLVGRDVVLDSWRAILEAPTRPEITPTGAVAHTLGEAAFVTCYERIGGAVLIATNVFVLERGGWRMTHHHASPTPMAPARPTGHASGGAIH